METLSPEDLAKHDGVTLPAWVAFQGKVYDVSGSRLWKAGHHARRHQAGRDLTAELSAAPHGPEVLQRFSAAADLAATAAVSDRIPAWLENLLGRFPTLRRHPHPMLVHFPIAFFIGAAAFLGLQLATGVGSFGSTSRHCLAAAVLFTPLAMLTGLLTWWLNYEARPLRPVTLKIILSAALMADSLGALLLSLTGAGRDNPLYLILIILPVPLVAAIGVLGAHLTFPVVGN